MSRRRPQGSTKSPMGDWHLWTEVTRSVSPLRPSRTTPSSPKSGDLGQRPAVGSPTVFGRVQAKTVLRPTLQAPKPPNTYRTRQTGSLLNKSIEPGLRRRVARGRLDIDATLDLHGQRQSQAHAILSRFIEYVWQRGDRTVLIITGKGVKRTGFAAFEQKGVLRHAVPVWLAEPAIAARVAGWSPSAVGHGGEGALYVRLKVNSKLGRTPDPQGAR